MRLASLFALLSLFACTPSSSSGGGATVPPDADATPLDGSDVCGAACARLAALHCPEANPGDGGRSCVATCQHDTPGVVFDLHASSIASAKTVADVRAAGVACPGGAP